MTERPNAHMRADIELGVLSTPCLAPHGSRHSYKVTAEPAIDQDGITLSISGT
jgi:hypothetical protein